MKTHTPYNQSTWDEIKAILGLFIGILILIGFFKLGAVALAWFTCTFVIYCMP